MVKTQSQAKKICDPLQSPKNNGTLSYVECNVAPTI